MLALLTVWQLTTRLKYDTCPAAVQLQAQTRIALHIRLTQRIYEFRIAATTKRRQFLTQLNQFVFVMGTRCFHWGRNSICIQYLERRVLRPASWKLDFLVFHCIKANSEMLPKFQSLLYDSQVPAATVWFPFKVRPSQRFPLFSEQRPNSVTPSETRSLWQETLSVRC